jgi:hypothetical protein
LKDWLRNKERQLGIPANTLIHTYMMERLLERIAASPFKDQFIIKGGFLIASMIGIDLRSTLDMDTTIKGVPVSESTVREMLGEILAIDLGDHVQFVLEDVRNIHEEGPYEDFRLLLEARFFTVRVMLKIDITTGDVITPRSISSTFEMPCWRKQRNVVPSSILCIMMFIFSRSVAALSFTKFGKRINANTHMQKELSLMILSKKLAICLPA